VYRSIDEAFTLASCALQTSEDKLRLFKFAGILLLGDYTNRTTGTKLPIVFSSSDAIKVFDTPKKAADRYTFSTETTSFNILGYNMHGAYALHKDEALNMSLVKREGLDNVLSKCLEVLGCGYIDNVQYHERFDKQRLLR
jgi:hypothetical protein